MSSKEMGSFFILLKKFKIFKIKDSVLKNEEKDLSFLLHFLSFNLSLSISKKKKKRKIKGSNYLKKNK